MSQNELVLNHLKEYGSLTSLEAMNLYGISRLAARISDLRARGINISSLDKEVKTRGGRTARIAVYVLR